MSEKSDLLYAQRRQRLEKALNMEKIGDRYPVIIMGSVPIAKMADPKIVVADAIERPKYFIDKAFEGLENLKDADSISVFTYPISKLNGVAWMSKVKLPGVELGRDDMIQFVEDGKMTNEDYDVILNKGWKYYADSYIKNALGIYPDDKTYISDKEFKEYADKKVEEFGYVETIGWANPSIFDLLTSLRGIATFFRDMKKDPVKIKAVLDVLYEETLPDFKEQLKMPSKAFAAMVQPGVRANCDFISRSIYEKLVWPYTQGYGDAVLEAGIPLYFHYDANWDLFLDFFTYFPPYKCIFDTDGMTDIYKLKKILGGRMAITGNISPALLTLGTPDEVYNFIKKQISEIGPEGYIVTSSCTIPSNAKPENIKAMVEACR